MLEVNGVAKNIQGIGTARSHSCKYCGVVLWRVRLIGLISTPFAVAAASVSLYPSGSTWLAGFHNTATQESLGAISLRS